MIGKEEQNLIGDIQSKIKKYGRYEKSDQYIVYSLVWISIISSSSAALFTALGELDKTVLAILAAVPALSLTIESSFRFSETYQKRLAALADLDSIIYEILYEGLSVADASKRVREISRLFSTGTYIPTLSTSSKKKPEGEGDH